MSRGLDVYRYTGEGGKAWPATSEPAEVTRLRRIGAYTGLTPGAPAAPPAAPRPGDTRAIGTFKLGTRLKRVPGRRGRKVTLTFIVRDKTNVVVSKLRFTKRPGRRVRVRASGTALAGSYRYEIRVGDRGKVLRRGRIAVKAGKGALPPNLSLVCRIR